MRARQKVSRAGVELIKSFEGLRSTAARLPDGRWTLGYGHTFSAREGARVTQEDADALLRFDLLPIVDAINNAILVPLNQNQFDALVSFCFNIGVDNFQQSSVLKCINEGRMTEAALAMDSWRSAEFNGQTYVLAPLIRRRAAEKNLFLTPEDTAGNAPSLLVRPTVDTAPVADARPSELNAPDRGGVLSAYPMGEPGFSPYSKPVTQPPAPADRNVIDLNTYAPRPAEAAPSPYAASPYAAPRESVVEHLPGGAIPGSVVRETPAADAAPQMSPAVQAALMRAQEEQRLNEARAAEAARAEQERVDRERAEASRAERVRLDQEAFERGRIERERQERERLDQEARAVTARLEQERQDRERAEAARFEQARLEQARLEQARLEQERLDRERAEADRLEQERAAAAAAAVQPAPVDDEEAEKARKAEAAAALMRLYSPYGGGALGRPLAAAQPPKAPEPALQPAPSFTPYAQPFLSPVSGAAPTPEPTSVAPAPEPAHEVTAEPVVAPVAESDEDGSVVDFRPVESPRTMAPPMVTALNPYGRGSASPVGAPQPETQPDLIEVPRPQAVDLSATSASAATQPPPAQPVHWREQLQRPLPEGYKTAETEQAPLINQPGSHFESLYHNDEDEWTMEGGRVAVASDDHEPHHPSLWKMVVDTLWMLLVSGMGLACLGIAAAAFYKSQDPAVMRAGFIDDYTKLSLIMAVCGVLFVSISVWLIFKRLGGLRD